MDLTKMAYEVDLGREEYLELIDLFLETTSPNLTKLEVGVKTGDFRKVIESAHSIKGSAASLGLNDIFEMAKKMEMNARNHSLVDGDGTIQLIKDNLNRIAGSLAEEKAREATDCKLRSL